MSGCYEVANPFRKRRGARRAALGPWARGGGRSAAASSRPGTAPGRASPPRGAPISSSPCLAVPLLSMEDVPPEEPARPRCPCCRSRAEDEAGPAFLQPAAGVPAARRGWETPGSTSPPTRGLTQRMSLWGHSFQGRQSDFPVRTAISLSFQTQM